jgi:hypothetical protein
MPFIFEMVFGGALLLVSICLFIAFVSAVQDHRIGRKSMPLTAAGISLLWILLGLAWRGALGPDYSALRYSVIGLNLVCMLVSAVVAFAFRSQRSWMTGVAAFMLSCVWLYIGAISSVV